ncbi:MAG: hypothetical protein ABR599_01785 [Gemmatimonadota bacterium]
MTTAARSVVAGGRGEPDASLDVGTLRARFPALASGAAFLDTRPGDGGIPVWSGNFYALEVVRRLGLEPEGLLRAGFVHYNCAEDVDRLLAALADGSRPEED